MDLHNLACASSIKYHQELADQLAYKDLDRNGSPQSRM